MAAGRIQKKPAKSVPHRRVKPGAVFPRVRQHASNTTEMVNDRLMWQFSVNLDAGQ
jgi:hypothetical protein